MQQAKTPHGSAQAHPETRQNKGAAQESPQGEHIAQLDAMVDASPAMAAQRKLIGMIHNSPAMAAQRKTIDGIHGNIPAQREETEQEEPATAQRAEVSAKPNHTGLPDNLKTGIESLSGLSMDNVKVHYNSSQPAQLNALAYAQGTDIHVAPGQEQHLPHEAWHVVQQAQGRVAPTMQMKDGVPVNDDTGLEREADVMGEKALSVSTVQKQQQSAALQHSAVAQLLTPQGNLPTYDAATVNVVAQNAGNNPTDAIVRNSGLQGPASNPQDPGGWNDLVQGVTQMDDPSGLIPGGERTTFELDANIDYDNGHAYTRMHAVNSWLGLNSNNASNIFSGRQSFNKSHDQRIEGYANGFLDYQSWRVTTGQTLVNSLNNQDQIGRNGGGQYYYKAGGTNSFPAAFYNAGAMVVGNDGANYPALHSDKMALRGYCLEYEVLPTYNLNLATVKNNINMSFMGAYNARANARHNGETLDLNAGAIHNAVTALCRTYATNLQINATIHAPNLAAIANGSDITTDNLTWHPYQSAPVLMVAPRPAAEMKISYTRNTGNRYGRWIKKFEI